MDVEVKFGDVGEVETALNNTFAKVINVILRNYKNFVKTVEKGPDVEITSAEDLKTMMPGLDDADYASLYKFIEDIITQFEGKVVDPAAIKVFQLVMSNITFFYNEGDIRSTDRVANLLPELGQMGGAGSDDEAIGSEAGEDVSEPARHRFGYMEAHSPDESDRVHERAVVSSSRKDVFLNFLYAEKEGSTVYFLSQTEGDEDHNIDIQKFLSLNTKNQCVFFAILQLAIKAMTTSTALSATEIAQYIANTSSAMETARLRVQQYMRDDNNASLILFDTIFNMAFRESIGDNYIIEDNTIKKTDPRKFKSYSDKVTLEDERMWTVYKYIVSKKENLDGYFNLVKDNKYCSDFTEAVGVSKSERKDYRLNVSKAEYNTPYVTQKGGSDFPKRGDTVFVDSLPDYKDGAIWFTEDVCITEEAAMAGPREDIIREIARRIYLARPADTLAVLGATLPLDRITEAAMVTPLDTSKTADTLMARLREFPLSGDSYFKILMTGKRMKRLSLLQCVLL